MSKFFERIFSWEEFLTCNPNKIINFLSNLGQEPRADSSSFVQKLSEKCCCSIYQIEYQYEQDAFLFNGESYDLKGKTHVFLGKLDKATPLLLNITAMNLRLLGALLYNLKKLQFESVYCLYTEPLRYCKNAGTKSEDEYIDRFDLYRKFRGIEPIPGYLRANDDTLPEKWIAFLGFEGKRAEQINEKYEFSDMVPVITLPSYRPGWQNYALQENLDIIKNNGRKPEYVVANSFMSSYNYLDNLRKTYPNIYLRVTPMGTKVNALGILLYVLNCKKGIEVLYDNPIEEGKISDECGNTYVFDISEILNSAVK